MAQQVCVVLSAVDREQLATIAAYSSRRASTSSGRALRPPRGSALAAAGGAQHRRQPADGVALATTLRRERVEGLLRDKTRKPGKPADCSGNHGAGGGADLPEPPHQATHWTGRAMAKGPASRWGRQQDDLAGATNRSQPGCAPSNVRAIPASPPSSPTLSGSTSIRRPTRSCCRLTKRARSRPSTAPRNPDCRSNRAAAMTTITSGTVRPPCSPHLACLTAR